MGKHKALGECKTWSDFDKFAGSHGLQEIRTTGGHRIRGNSNGTMPFSTHDRGELSKGMRHGLAKEIMKLLGLLLLGLIPIFCIIFAALAFWQ